MSLSARRAWIEISTRNQPSRPKRSLSARRAWIEIHPLGILGWWALVALRKESVDRNKAGDLIGTQGQTSLSARRAWIEIKYFALNIRPLSSLSARRAWIEIDNRHTQRQNEPASLSARRAWIEICTATESRPDGRVALRKESVDRNLLQRLGMELTDVALRKESVDRNSRFI